MYTNFFPLNIFLIHVAFSSNLELIESNPVFRYNLKLPSVASENQTPKA